MSVVRPVDEQRGVLISGGASGIGLAAARRLAAQGRAIALFDIDEDRVQLCSEELLRAGATVVGIAGDVGDEAQVEEGFTTARAAVGPIDGLVCCAGIDRGARLDELSAAVWDEVIAVNLRGTFLTCRAAVRGMLRDGDRGAVVCVSSPFALVATPGGIGAYAASKAGICGLVRSLAVDYARSGIRVNAVLPGPTETPLMWANVDAGEVEATREVVAGEVPLGRLADPSEPAEAVVWLLSDAASFVTGAQLACDGGLLARAAVSA